MSEELKENENKECKCFCKSKGFRKFLTIALGTFVGVYCALTLFAATHRPPMPPCAFGPQGGMRGCPVKVIHNHFNKPHRFDKPNFQRPDRPDFQRPDFNQPAPFEAQRPQPGK